MIGSEGASTPRPSLTETMIWSIVMADRQLPSIDLLRQILRYEPDTGKLFWRERPVGFFQPSDYAGVGERSADWSAAKWNTRHAGREAFISRVGRGYLAGKVMGVKLNAHRVIWALVHGEWPVHEIDHINCDKTDNRISNLRLATASENARNRPTYSNNSSGFKGVSWNRQAMKWTAGIRLDGKRKHLGYFDGVEDAALAYAEAAAMHYGSFARVA